VFRARGLAIALVAVTSFLAYGDPDFLWFLPLGLFLIWVGQHIYSRT